MVGVKGLHGLLLVRPGVHTRKGIGTGLFSCPFVRRVLLRFALHVAPRLALRLVLRAPGTPCSTPYADSCCPDASGP